MKIEINKDSVRKQGEEILSCVDEFDSNIKKMISIIDNITSVWEGKDSLKFANTMKGEYIPNLQKLNDMIKEYGMYLKKVPGAYDVVDEVFSSKKINL